MTKTHRAPTGHICGQSHYRARLSDEQVKNLRADYKPFVFSIQKCADKYRCGFSTARDIIYFATRKNAI